MICKLCLKDKKLLKSHILPEFFYEPLYDPPHRFNILYTGAGEKNEYKQKGIYEKLLCDDCEKLLSKYEKYASGLFCDGIALKTNVTGINYQKFKIFQLSILWRAGVSTNKIFSEVNLGPHEDRIRRMILQEQPGKYYEYGCILIAILNKNKLFKQIISPKLLRICGYHCFRFVMGGCCWTYFVSNRNQLTPYKDGFMKEDGSLIIYKNNIKEFPFIKDLAHELYTKGKFAGF